MSLNVSYATIFIPLTHVSWRPHSSAHGGGYPYLETIAGALRRQLLSYCKADAFFLASINLTPAPPLSFVGSSVLNGTWLFLHCSFDSLRGRAMSLLKQRPPQALITARLRSAQTKRRRTAGKKTEQRHIVAVCGDSLDVFTFEEAIIFQRVKTGMKIWKQFFPPSESCTRQNCKGKSHLCLTLIPGFSRARMSLSQQMSVG